MQQKISQRECQNHTPQLPYLNKIPQKMPSISTQGQFLGSSLQNFDESIIIRSRPTNKKGKKEKDRVNEQQRMKEQINKVIKIVNQDFLHTDIIINNIAQMDESYQLNNKIDLLRETMFNIQIKHLKFIENNFQKIQLFDAKKEKCQKLEKQVRRLEKKIDKQNNIVAKITNDYQAKYLALQRAFHYQNCINIQERKKLMELLQAFKQTHLKMRNIPLDIQSGMTKSSSNDSEIVPSPESNSIFKYFQHCSSYIKESDKLIGEWQKLNKRYTSNLENRVEHPSEMEAMEGIEGIEEMEGMEESISVRNSRDEPIDQDQIDSIIEQAQQIYAYLGGTQKQ